MSTPFSGSKAAAAARHKDSERLAGKGVDLQIPDLIAPNTSLQPDKMGVSQAPTGLRWCYLAITSTSS
jgi:hypothetical protein